MVTTTAEAAGTITVTVTATDHKSMKTVKYDVASRYLNSTSRLNNSKANLDGGMLRYAIPYYENSSATNSLVIKEVKTHSFDLDNLAKLAEDHGYVLMSSDYKDELVFSNEQVIHSTFFNKLSPTWYKFDHLRLGWLITPFKGCKIEDTTLVLIDDGQIDLSDIIFDEVVTPEEFKPYAAIQLDGPSTVSPGKTIDISVAQSIPSTTLYITASAGTLNKSRLQQSGLVKLTATDLNPGDKIKVSAGYKYWTGDSDLIITVE